jgi:DNA-3-methyladenine glycosylase II
LARIVAAYGPPPLWARPGGFRTLVKIILEQQVSLASAASLFRRVDGELPGGWSPAAVVRAGESGMRAHGLTRQKAGFVVSLAERVSDDPQWFRRLTRLDDADALGALTSLHGIGPWTASIYLLMVLRRPDVWPPGDLALHKAMATLPGQLRVPGTKEATVIAERWAPHRATAARILWHGYLRQKVEG